MQMQKQILSPMMQQYMDIKEQHKDCILFFRLGDFYEMFFEDAIIASREMEVTLTGKNCGQEERAPMCGVPFHSSDTYISRLVEKGYKVAVCEQVEDAAAAKGIVKREVVQIITPGTLMSQTMLNEKENNYLASVCVLNPRTVGLTYGDVSTGELNAVEISGENVFEILTNELVKINAREILLNSEFELSYSSLELENFVDSCISKLQDNYCTFENAVSLIKKQFSVESLEGLGILENSPAVLSLGAMLSYIFETGKQSLTHIKTLKVYDIANHMSLDKATLKNLELTETLFDKKVQGSLLGLLDKTHTAMGSRRMKQWLKEPLNHLEEIQMRLNAVESLTDNILIRNHIKEHLKKIYDLERLSGRIAYGNINARDLLALKGSIFVIPELKEELESLEDIFLSELNNDMHPLREIWDIIDHAIVEDPPIAIKEGGLIQNGYDSELDAIKYSIKDGQVWIAELEGKERERTGIKNLKVGFNKVFGYYLEITKSYYNMIPDNYIRKQTLSNCERFITPELKEMESLVLNAEAKINQMEYDIFTKIRERIKSYTSLLQETAVAISQVDVLTAFAHVGETLGYCKPIVNSSSEIIIEKGRHPVIENTVKNSSFVSNDTYINDSNSSMLLITGPNMAGKSTYMRQTALIVLMAQAGSFVPCDRASIGIVDRIYTRIGASDNLAQGKSTFFVEMSELAYILNTATEKSLVILDEIGRGTSTYDGLSIAWSVVEYMCCEKRKIRTLFATHYHELTILEEQINGVKNLNVDVAEENGNVVFLHKIKAGSASQSYGIHVAKLAGVPSDILRAAESKLLHLEIGSESDRDNLGSFEKTLDAKKDISVSSNENQQISFFSFAPNPVVERLRQLDLMQLAPWEALKILEELKEAAND